MMNKGKIFIAVKIDERTRQDLRIVAVKAVNDFRNEITEVRAHVPSDKPKPNDQKGYYRANWSAN